MQDRQAEQGAERRDGQKHGVEEQIERKAAMKNNTTKYWGRLVSEQWYMKSQITHASAFRNSLCWSFTYLFVFHPRISPCVSKCQSLFCWV